MFGETGNGNIFIIMGGHIIFEDGSHDYLTNYIGWEFTEDDNNNRDKYIKDFKDYTSSYGIVKLVTNCNSFSDYKKNTYEGQIFFKLNKNLYL